MRLAFHLMDQFMAERGLTKKAFAELLGWHETRYPQYRSGSREVSFDTAALIERRTEGKVPMHSWFVDVEDNQIDASIQQIGPLTQTVRAFWSAYNF